MPRTRVNIAQGYYRDESFAISNRDCVNFFPHIPEGATVTDGSLIGVSGIEQVTDTAVNAFNRGGSELAGIPYFVCGSKLWRVEYTTDFAGVRTYSTVDVSGAEAIEGTARCFFSNNGDQLVIVAPDHNTKFNAWVYTVAGGLVQISDSDFDGPVSCVTFMDGYFIYAKANSNKWFISDLRDGLAYNALDFASAESDPDPIVVIAPLNGLLYVFGSRTVEPYQNVASGSGFPFERISSGIQQKGCLAPHSMVEVNGALVWVGTGENERPAIYITNGSLPQKLSPASVDNLIYEGGIDLATAAFVIRWSERGHTFVSFTVPGITTIVYDSITGLWHRRQSLDRFLDPQPWRVTAMVDAYSVILVADELSGIIGLMSENIYYEYGEEIRGYFTLPAIEADGKPFTLNQVQTLMETGTNPLNGQGNLPIVRMSVSYDGGKLYAPEISRAMGLTGHYYQPIEWSQLGRYPRSCTLRFDISEPIKRVFVKVEVDISA